MKYNIKFSPEKRKAKSGELISINVPLFADIRFSGSRVFYFTGYRIDVDWINPGRSAWNFDKEEMRKGAHAREGKQSIPQNRVNSRLDLIRGEVAKLFTGTPTKAEVISKLDDVCGKVKKPNAGEMEFYPMFEKYTAEAKLSAEKREHVHVALNHWRRFNDKLKFAGINSDTLKAFEKFLLSEKKEVKSTGKIKAVRGINTVHSVIKMTRAFWNACREEYREKGKNLHYPFENYTIPAEVYTRPIYITKEERDILFNKELPNERLQKVRDIFVFQCLTGARVGDLVKLTKENINHGILSYIPRKTKDDKPVIVTVPLSSKAKEILSRYDMPDGRLLPFITDQRYNDYIKELFEYAGLTRIVTRLNPTTRKEEQVRLCDIASSHMARRAFIGNLYGKVDSGIISSMSGHIQGSKAFTRYYDVSTELQEQAINLID